MPGRPPSADVNPGLTLQRPRLSPPRHTSHCSGAGTGRARLNALTSVRTATLRALTLRALTLPLGAGTDVERVLLGKPRLEWAALQGAFKPPREQVAGEAGGNVFAEGQEASGPPALSLG